MEKSKRKPRQDESTEAESRGGSTYSSEETTEKVVERRGRIILFWRCVNYWKVGGTMDKTKPYDVCTLADGNSALGWIMGAG